MAVVPLTPGQTGGVNASTFGAPVFDDSMTFREVGQTGLRQYGGWVREEFLPQLLGRQAARVYREMQDNDATIGSMLFAITQTMRKIKWRVKPADDSAEALAEAQFADSLRFDMSSTWEDFIVEALSMLAYGFSAHEIVYKHRNGRHEQSGPYDDIATSLFDDGRIGIRKLPIRSQDTVIKWFFGPNGSIEGLTQQPFNGPINHIPIEKLLLFRPTSHKGNPEGRALAPETMIPTPDGWRVLDSLQPGDKVFDEQGRIRYITARADWPNRPCFRVTFGDGSEIVADAAHQWVTTTLKERSAAKPGRVRTTETIAASLKTHMGSSNHGIAWASPLDYPEQILPLDPYVLGMWLGDGTSRSASITCHADDATETCALIEACGYPTAISVNGEREGNGRLIRFYGDAKWASDGPSKAIGLLGLWQNKHVPLAYLRGSTEQRMALLSGLMDSDGHVDAWGRCEFTNTNVALAAGVAELVRSLGIGPRMTTKVNSHGNTCWLVKFTPTFVPFRLGRKAARCRTERQRKHHYISVIEPVEPRRTVCIEVDSPSHLFLAGEAMIPTHNSILRNSYRSWFFLKRFEEEEAIFYERMSGVPVMFVPQELMEAASSGDANAILQVNAYKRMVTNTKIGEQMGLLLPSNCWPNAMGAQGTAKMYEFQLVAPQGRASGPDSDKIISRHRLSMLMSVLADFVILGHAAHGTQSLAETKVDMFFQGVEGWLNGIAAVLNRYLLPRVWHLNALDPKLMPEFVPDLAQRLDIGALSDYVLKLAQSGMMMFPDTDLENYLRDSAGMPSIDETAYADNEQASNTAMSIDDINHNVAQRTPKPGLVTNPSIEATGTGAVSKPAAQAAIAKMLLAAEERRQRRHA